MNTKAQDPTKEKVFVRCSKCGEVLSFFIDKHDHQYIPDVAAGFGWTFCNGKYACKNCEEECP